MNTNEKNLFSNWFPKIKDCGIRVPQSIIIQVPEHIQQCFCMEDYETDAEKIQSWVTQEVLPRIRESELSGHPLFIKNGCFSNKYEARYCFCMETELAESIMRINYQAMYMDAGGISELIIRERIPHDASVTPCIYNGLPLRPEFRVFYDFTKHQVLFTANVWSYDYVYPRLYDITDKIILEHEKMDTTKVFVKERTNIEALVMYHMNSVEGLEGVWAIDIMLTEQKEPILVDMAIAEGSAHWGAYHDEDFDSQNERLERIYERLAAEN